LKAASEKKSLQTSLTPDTLEEKLDGEVFQEIPHSLKRWPPLEEPDINQYPHRLLGNSAEVFLCCFPSELKNLDLFGC